MRFIGIVAACFLFFVTFAFALNQTEVAQYSTSASVLSVKKEEKVELITAPVRKDDVTFPELSAQAVLAVDLDTNISLYEKDADGSRLPASTTKIITALVAMDNYPLDKIISVGNVNVEGQKMDLVVGEEMTVEDLLYGLLVYSANDAAEVLAENYQGGRDAFIEAMNLKAKEIGLDNTNLTNPSGLDGEEHRTTARDLVKAGAYAMNRPVFRQIVGTKELTVSSVDGEVVHRLENINELIGEEKGVLGIKTGWTKDARENLVTYIERTDEVEEGVRSSVDENQRSVVMVVLGSQDRFGETKELINWIFENYDWVEIPVDQLSPS